MKHSSKYSLLIICLLFIQLITPYTQVLANEIVPPSRFWHKVENGNDVTLSWQVDYKVEEYRLYQIEDGNRQLLLAKKAGQYKMSDLPEGQYSFEVASFSEEFGESSPISLSFDIEHPVIQAPIRLNADVINGNDIVLTWKASDFATSYEVYQVGNDGKKLIDTVSTTRFVAENMPEGQYAYEVYAVSDRFGKSATPSYVEYTLTYPTMQPPSYGRARIEKLNDLVITWNSDNLATEYYLYQVIDGEDQLIEKRLLNYYKSKVTENGDLVFKIRTYSDRFGLSPKALTLTLDSVDLVLNTPELRLKSFNGQIATLSWNRVLYADSYNLYQIVDGKEELVLSTRGNTVTFDDLEVGPHQFVVRAVNDTIGESESSNAISFEVLYDIRAPKTTTNTTASWTNQEVTVELTATDDKSGVDKTYYTLGNDESAETYEGNTFRFSEEGIFNYSFYSVDKAGNIERVTNEMVRIDKTPPVTTTNATDGLHDTFTLKMDGLDHLSGLDATFYSINGNDFRVGNIITLTQKGQYTVSFYSRDRAGNKEPVQTVHLKINGLEKPEDEIPLFESTGLEGEELEKLLEFIGNDPVKLEELANLEKNHPLPVWDPAKKNEQLPQVEEFLNGLQEITGTEVETTMDEQPVTFEELVNMDKLTSDVVINISEPNGEKLADIILTAALEEAIVEEEPTTDIPSNKEPVQTPSEFEVDIVRKEEIPTKIKESAVTTKTVDGAKLPNTASNMPLNILLGLVMMLVGALIFIKNKKKSPTRQSE